MHVLRVPENSLCSLLWRTLFAPIQVSSGTEDLGCFIQLPTTGIHILVSEGFSGTPEGRAGQRGLDRQPRGAIKSEDGNLGRALGPAHGEGSIVLCVEP